MKIFNALKQYSENKPIALSLGMFDGVHLGHQTIIKEINELAKERNLESAILTFTPHPRIAFNPNDDLKYLNTFEEKKMLLSKFGIQNLFIQNFDGEFRNLTGEEFIRKVLINTLHTKLLIIGYDHSFGKNRSGNFELLKQLAPELGYDVLQMEAVNLYNHNVSSTKIRKALEVGKINEANAMLGYHYPISGKVVDGKKLGRSIGYPTANIAVSKEKLLPKKGAYIVDVFVQNKKYMGMLSIGTNPTVNGEHLTVEVHILNFDKDIYGEDIQIHFREFLHEEIKFESLPLLIEKLDEDKEKTLGYFNTL